jgi:hypothetical protein
MGIRLFPWDISSPNSRPLCSLDNFFRHYNILTFQASPHVYGTPVTATVRILAKNILKSFDSDFSDNISHIERYTRIFNDEITLAHRQRLESANKQLQMMVKQSSLDNATLINMAESREADGKQSNIQHVLIFPFSQHSIDVEDILRRIL